MFFAKDSPDINFVIISPEPNIGRLKGTVRSIKNNYREDAKIICSVEKGIKKPQIEEMREVCPSFRGGQTVTSLINNGMKHAPSGWNMLVVEGAWVPKNIQYKYSKWISSPKDVLFPIVINFDRQGMPARILSTFGECTLNGILLNKDFFFEIGNLSENPLKISREFWAMEAADKGANFKAILGIKIC
jgi:hypothetical protein